MPLDHITHSDSPSADINRDPSLRTHLQDILWDGLSLVLKLF